MNKNHFAFVAILRSALWDAPSIKAQMALFFNDLVILRQILKMLIVNTSNIHSLIIKRYSFKIIIIIILYITFINKKNHIIGNTVFTLYSIFLKDTKGLKQQTPSIYRYLLCFTWAWFKRQCLRSNK